MRGMTNAQIGGGGGHISNSDYVSLTINTDYTTTSDGYFYIFAGASQRQFAYGYVDDVLLLSCGTPINAATENNQCASVYVRKGAVLKFSGTANVAYGRFYPLS